MNGTNTIEKTEQTTNGIIDLSRPSKIGEIIEGKIIAGERSSLFIDLGAWGTGVIFGKEFIDAKTELKKLEPGNHITVKVVDLDNEDGYIELSLKQADKELTWDSLKEKKEKNEIIAIKITGANKGGLLTEIASVPAFLPVSQLSSQHYPRVEGADKIKILEELKKFIGQELKVKILDLGQQEEKIILSEKIEELEKIKEVLKSYKLDQIVEGEITGIADFGVFIKFGSEELEGLIHISELDWQLIEDPNDIVEVGEKVKAKVIDISDGKVSLSLKALKENPWEKIEGRYSKGDIVEGTVSKFNPFGAFVKLAPKIQGLVHISEFGSQEKMEKGLEVGKKYKFKILTIEPHNYKMTLQLV